MNTYAITYSFNRGPDVTVEKDAISIKAAKKALWLQLGSRFVEILHIERVEK